MAAGRSSNLEAPPCPAPSVLRLALALVLACAAAACAEPSAGRVDDAGRPVALTGTPQRVVPLAPNLTELVAASAGVGRLAAVSPADTFPAGLEGLPRFSSYPLDVERLVGLQPDLVLASSDVNAPAQIEGLVSVGLPVYTFRFDELADVPRALRTLDTLLDTRGGEAVAQEFEARRAAVTDAVQPFSRPRVLLLVGAEGLYAFGRESPASELVRVAGGENLTDRYDGAASTPGAEDILEMAPEVIVVLGGDDARARLLAAQPALAETPAVRSGRVYGIDPDLVSRPGPRLIDGLERLARLLHPEAFAAGAA